MKTSPYIRALFIFAGLYDGLIGLIFLIHPLWLYDIFAVTPPNHLAYVQFPAALLIIFAIMFFMIARDPVKNCHLVCYGILLKFSFCGIAFYYWILEGIPGMWKPFAVADLLFLAVFVILYNHLKKAAEPGNPPG